MLYETKRNYTGACLRRLLHKNLSVANIARPVHDATHSMHVNTSIASLMQLLFYRVSLTPDFISVKIFIACSYVI